MDKDIVDHIQKCHKCQARRTDHKAPPQLLSPLPQCTEPNQRIHCDLFGPLKISGNAKKFILCMTDAFTKYVELVALPDKEALTVTSAIFNRWICRYGLPLEIVTDQGREFCNKSIKGLRYFNYLKFNLCQTVRTTIICFPKQMPLASEYKKTYEKTPFFSDKTVPELVNKFNSSIKLIVMIRDPVTRTISGFTHAMSKIKKKINPNRYSSSSRLFEEYVLLFTHNVHKMFAGFQMQVYVATCDMLTENTEYFK